MVMNEKNNLDMDLDPEVIKVRDKIITKIGDKPLEEVNSIRYQTTLNFINSKLTGLMSAIRGE